MLLLARSDCVLTLHLPRSGTPTCVHTLRERHTQAHIQTHAQTHTLTLRRFAALARGFVHYPVYTVWRAQSAFSCAEELHAYEDALQQAAALDDALEVCV